MLCTVVGRRLKSACQPGLHGSLTYGGEEIEVEQQNFRLVGLGCLLLLGMQSHSHRLAFV